jgi:CubicO group peptidase (beta-lactamase class C family)
MTRILLLFLIGLIISCKPKTTPITIELDNYFSNEFPVNEPGGAVLVMKGEEIIFSKGYGISDIVAQEKITPQTLFNIGSISKTFVSNIILSLEEENKLSIYDSLYKYFPDFKNKEIAQKVKLHHLLSHSAGLPDNRWDVLDSVFLLTAKDEENWAPIKQNDSLLFEPGSRFEYSNPAYNGLALIIEKVTGKKWQDVVKEKIFQPSGMATSKITDGAYPQEGVAHAYLKIRNRFIEKDYGEEPTFAAAGNGGVWSSVEELANYEIALRKAIFLKKETIERSRTPFLYPNWKDSIPPFIGHSWFIGQQGGLKIVSHTGSQGGFISDYVSIPEKGILYVILCNTLRPIGTYRKRIFELWEKDKWLK